MVRNISAGSQQAGKAAGKNTCTPVLYILYKYGSQENLAISELYSLFIVQFHFPEFFFFHAGQK